ncbi:MAG: hypothetical protein A2805_02430 [Candidatus Andersenbacteria bacterium RIFCSPHIGHO2_01_FULL_46_36]|uniref:RNA 2',3'-cyclic 3'-phosphodiesterase n=1 Tax=Candidatus Andersenbacteria bacterium RIFCSPHIGHO2_12_FULL_45_11 TaxID=1797281 RepID=A0A1G1X251_9BACT|nr:MAG: hypothetical protein A2805_02430 [Candidatus Andersenbacteria bacterium RIFCSPHIGHO2_01_FULL_46_36]OGY34053.1 MAG: hypothetical protein A3D99_02240 [Candidatus Andersenbacteria bacterium RIFCSPHIGHO2_12_FULL_45_11]
MNTFIALGIPKPAAAVLTAALEAYKGKLATRTPEEKWHMTLVFLSDAAFSAEAIQKIQEPLHSAYLPAITILSLGAALPAGRQEGTGQLWAHVHATPALIQVRAILIDRLTQSGIAIPEQELSREFTPHINLGDSSSANGAIGISDTPAKITFAVKEALVLRSISKGDTTMYEKIATIPLVP